MKSLLNVFVAILLAYSISAQNSGVIQYTETMKFEIKMDDLPAGVDLSGMLPSSRTEDKVLTYDGHKSIYVDGQNEEEDTEMTSDDGSFKMVIMGSEVEAKYYVDQKTNESLSQEDFMGKAFIVMSDVMKYKWKITNEKVKYLDYECIKATTTAMNGEEEEQPVAWFAPAIATSAGPAGFGQLPGAILMLSKGGDRVEIKAIQVDVKEVDEIKKPNDGKKVTVEEYDKIVEEKMKEMEQQYGGSTISIRG